MRLKTPQLKPTRAATGNAVSDELTRDLLCIGHLSWAVGDRDIEASPDALRILNQPLGEPLRLDRLLGQVRRNRCAQLKAQWAQAVACRTPRIEAELPLVFDDKSKRHVRLVGLVDYAEDGRVLGCRAAIQDASELSQTSTTLAQTLALLHDAQELSHLGHWEWDFARNRASYSAEAARILGLQSRMPTLEELGNLVPEGQKQVIAALFKDAISQGLTTLRYDFTSVRTGSLREFETRVRFYYGDQGLPLRLLATIQDVTELRTTRRQLHSLSYFDPITSLPNRTLLADRMQTLMDRPAESGTVFGLLTLCLDRFKHVQDSLGHTAGDALLRQAANRLTGLVRSTDTVARLAGEHFAVLLPDVPCADELSRIASKLLRAFALAFDIEGGEVFVGASLGAALYPADAAQANELLQHADTALSHARAKGNHVTFYSSQLTAQAAERLRLESELRKGLDRGELVLHYQPKFELGSQRLVGAEALMRWKHPQRGMVSPLSFIPMAEETGLIVPMGQWALHEACRTVVHWNEGRTAMPLKVAVNLSARQFADGNLVHAVTGALSATGCPPQWLELEITESLLLDARDDIRVALETLSNMGITIALDDFGTGYSALSYLTRLPVQTLKIDRSFVKGLPHDRNSVELSRAIVSLGKGLNMVLVAEGIETPEQAAFLLTLGCDLVQGFLFGRPMEAAEFQKLL